MTALNFKWEYKKINFLRLRRMQSFIPRSCFAEDGLEMYKVLKYKCTAVVRLINSFFRWRSHCRRLLRLFKDANKYWRELCFKSDFPFGEDRRAVCTCSLGILAFNFQFLLTFSADEVTAITSLF